MLQKKCVNIITDYSLYLMLMYQNWCIDQSAQFISSQLIIYIHMVLERLLLIILWQLNT